MLSRVGGLSPPSSTTWRRGVPVQSTRASAQQNPASSRADGDRDDCGALAALVDEAVPDAVQALLGLPADRHDLRALPFLASLERDAAGGGLLWSRYDVGEVPLRVLLRRRPPEPGVTVSDHRALQRLFRDGLSILVR
jgi:hypothetical protein